MFISLILVYFLRSGFWLPSNFLGLEPKGFGEEFSVICAYGPVGEVDAEICILAVMQLAERPYVHVRPLRVYVVDPVVILPE